MIVQEEAAMLDAMERKISSDPWAALLLTGTMPREDAIPLESGVFEIPVDEPARIRAA